MFHKLRKPDPNNISPDKKDQDLKIKKKNRTMTGIIIRDYGTKHTTGCYFIIFTNRIIFVKQKYIIIKPVQGQ